MLTKEQSERLHILRFPLILGVIFIHAAVFDVQINGHNIGVANSSLLSELLINYFSHSLGRISVPLFFLTASFFLFLKLKSTIDSYKTQITKRSKSLLIPYFFWNLLVFIFYIIIETTPSLSVFLSPDKARITEKGIGYCLKVITGLTEYPVAYQLWFIRNLFLLCLISPFFYY